MGDAVLDMSLQIFRDLGLRSLPGEVQFDRLDARFDVVAIHAVCIGINHNETSADPQVGNVRCSDGERKGQRDSGHEIWSFWKGDIPAAVRYDVWIR